MENLYFLIPTLGERKKELVRLFDSLLLQTNNDFKIIIVSQDNYQTTEKILEKYKRVMEIEHIYSEKKGISVARNIGLTYCRKGIVVLSDDDCWYPVTAVEDIKNEFTNRQIDVLLSQIFDYENNKMYKDYDTVERYITSKFQMMSRSSIEIAFKKEICDCFFDENMGVGSNLVCGEEIDFLLRNIDKKIYYKPIVTVYHPKKFSSSNEQIVAKGYLYGKHFNRMIGLLICIRDLIKKRENNFRYFRKGFKLAKQNNEKDTNFNT